MKNRLFLARLRFAFTGIQHALRAEHSFRVHAVAVLLVIIGLVVLRPAPLWWAMVALASAGVLAAELFNTAIEHLADHLHPELHPAIRVVKDCAAAAVLLSVAGALLVAVALLVHLWRGG